MKLMSNPKGLIGALAKEFVAPDFLAGYLQEEAKGKTVPQFYKYIEEGIWNSLPPGQKQFLINQKPWNLEWFTFDFILKAIAKSNPTIACLIMTSPQLQKEIQSQIEDIKHQLS